MYPKCVVLSEMEKTGYYTPLGIVGECLQVFCEGWTPNPSTQKEKQHTTGGRCKYRPGGVLVHVQKIKKIKISFLLLFCNFVFVTPHEELMSRCSVIHFQTVLQQVKLLIELLVLSSRDNSRFKSLSCLFVNPFLLEHRTTEENISQKVVL